MSEVLARVVIEMDHDLEAAAEKASAELCHHRWHWTLDETNPGRVSQHSYATAVGRNVRAIQRDSNGYAMWVGQSCDTASPDPRGRMTLTECKSRAYVSAEREEAIDAIAEAEGVTFQTVHRRARSGGEIDAVQTHARHIVEQRGGSMSDAVRTAANARARSRAADEKDAQRVEERPAALAAIAIEGRLLAAKRDMLDALKLARVSELDTDTRELLDATMEGLRALLALISMAIVDESRVDWDAELAKLGEME